MRVLKARALGGKWLSGVGICLFLLAACNRAGPAATPRPAQETAAPASAKTVAPTMPTPTPTLAPTSEPLAASVNGDGILLAAYQKEVERCRAGKTSVGAEAADCSASALQSLIEQKVIEQAAVAAGLSVSDEELQAAQNQVTQSLGSPEAYTNWLAANLYTETEFRQALRLDRLRAKMAEQVMASVGTQAEQVHAQALVVADEATAVDLLAQLKAGADFSKLALAYSLDLSSRAAGGDLGWFPRGLLTAPEVEQAAFALQPGETSDVIHSLLGYHIVRVLERDPARPLSPAAAQTLRARAYQAWLEARLSEAVIQKIVSP